MKNHIMREAIEHVLEQAKAEYGDLTVEVDLRPALTEFVELTKDAIRHGDEHVIISSSLALLIAYSVDTCLLERSGR